METRMSLVHTGITLKNSKYSAIRHGAVRAPGRGHSLLRNGVNKKTMTLAVLLFVALTGCNFTPLKYDLGLYERAPAVYTVTYKAPGREGTPPGPQTVPADGTAAERTITLATPGSLEWTGREFTGWLTAEGMAKGKDPQHLDDPSYGGPADGSYTVTKDTTFYAQWEGAYNIIYYPNNASDGGYGEPFAEVTGVTSSVKVAYPEGLTKDGYVFVCWTTDRDGAELPRYRWDSAEDEETFVTVTSNVTLYAQWGYSVTYDAKGGAGGTLPPTQYLLEGEEHTVEAPAGTLTKGGRNFIGWGIGSGVDRDLYVPGGGYKTAVSYSNAVDGSITLDAVYLGDPCEGGWVFYDNKGTQWASDEWRFLVAMPTDLEVGGREHLTGYVDKYYFQTEWSPLDGEFYSNIPGTQTGTGTGKENTELLYNFMSTGDAWRDKLTGSASYYGATAGEGWFLPSIGELEALYTFVKNAGAINGFTPMSGAYWSSSQDNGSIYNRGESPNWNPADWWLEEEAPADYPTSQAMRAWALLFGEWVIESDTAVLGYDGAVYPRDANVVYNKNGEETAPVQGVPFTHTKNAIHKVRPVRRF
jgi:uncharacterized repeat protein (TIGR02543 family)